jgi:hypothetical protein
MLFVNCFVCVFHKEQAMQTFESKMIKKEFELAGSLKSGKFIQMAYSVVNGWSCRL